MAELWPWGVVAGLGALHGLSPANGWLLAAACAVQTHDPAQARRALGPIALGQVASIAALAGALSFGLSLDRTLMRDLAVATFALGLGAAAGCGLRGSARRMPLAGRAGHAGIAVWSFLAASAQGAGLMLVPALAPWCEAGAGTRALDPSGTLATTFAAVAVHTAAMLLSTGLVAAGAHRGVARLVGSEAWQRYALARAGRRKAMAAAPNMSRAPAPSLQPNRSSSATTPTATAITGLTNA
jgi:hypothetical protein